ncbi:hypothetical protein HKD37_08G023247 [Glycine soja]
MKLTRLFIWSDPVIDRVDSPDSPTSTESQSLLSKDHIIVAISDLHTHINNRFNSLLKSVCFTEDFKENCDFLFETECFMPVLVGSCERGIHIQERGHWVWFRRWMRLLESLGKMKETMKKEKQAGRGERN